MLSLQSIGILQNTQESQLRKSFRQAFILCSHWHCPGKKKKGKGDGVDLSSHLFSILKDKHLISSIILGPWCPTGKVLPGWWWNTGTRDRILQFFYQSILWHHQAWILPAELPSHSKFFIIETKFVTSQNRLSSLLLTVNISSKCYRYRRRSID